MKNIADQRFGRLTALHTVKRYGQRYWYCRCDCGGERAASSYELRSGRAQSCGCKKRRPGTHNKSKTPLYKRWISMRSRCRNPNNHQFKWYGQRGIFVCDEWQTFPPFEKWAATSGFKPELQLDRINNNGPYSPENCRWVTPGENNSNKRNNSLIPVNGRLLTIGQAAELAGVSRTCIHHRLRRGWLPEMVVRPKEEFDALRMVGRPTSERLLYDAIHDPTLPL